MILRRILSEIFFRNKGVVISYREDQYQGCMVSILKESSAKFFKKSNKDFFRAYLI